MKSDVKEMFRLKHMPAQCPQRNFEMTGEPRAIALLKKNCAE
jgi:hypothetical protein